MKNATKNVECHLSSYVKTLRSIKQAEERRQMEKNIKFMAKPFLAMQKLNQYNGNDKANSIELKFKSGYNDKKLMKVAKNSESFGANKKPFAVSFTDKNTGLKLRKKQTNPNIRIGGKSGKIACLKQVEINNFIKENTEGKKQEESFTSQMSTKKKKLEKKKCKRLLKDKIRRKGAKTQNWYENREKMEQKMRKILKTQVKLKRKNAEKERKKEKTNCFQLHLQNFGAKISSTLKKAFDFLSVATGMILLTLGLFISNIKSTPFLLIGALLLLIGVGCLSARAIRWAEASRRSKNYKITFLSNIEPQGIRKNPII